MLDIDTAIKHCLDVAEQNETQAEKWHKEGGAEWGKTINCRECAADHRQLAEWLRELKEAKRLLKSAVESLRWLALHTEDSYGSCVIRDDNAHNKCDNCPLDNPKYTDCKWEYEAEALKLIGDESSGI